MDKTNRKIRRVADMAHKTGTVKFFDQTKGFGFIACPGLKDIFIHISTIESSGFTGGMLNEKQDVQVEFLSGPGRNGREQVIEVFNIGEHTPSFPDDPLKQILRGGDAGPMDEETELLFRQLMSIGQK